VSNVAAHVTVKINVKYYVVKYTGVNVDK